MKIIVPATTANIGLGFDSIGIAVGLYLTLRVVEPSNEWKIKHPFGEAVPSNQENLIIETALAVCPTLQPHHLVCESDIPMTRGLGSSSSAIVAGIELANQLGDLNLTPQQKVEWATKLEGHPDNVAPAILGGLVVATYDEESQEVDYLQKEIQSDIQGIALIPDFELSTKASRQVLPSEFLYSKAVQASSRSNVLVAALWQEDWENVSRIVEKDLFHEPYRETLIPFLTPVRKLAKEKEAIGTYLSGAGPTVMVLSSKDKSTTIVEHLQEHLPSELGNYNIQVLTVDQLGVRVEKR
ncbi:homoserine kinase [Granulicatella elegans]|uniref:Homoserine kinase n=1 Tax=Granulicatella elegans ATCC 700633 TaxID=626369 RepID=D0BLE5_9LACT|nr:homoserine kinase [Granulicatella elegans]EEW93898.1 homoserine kinase [Granulicatella elegans ATCC 700633]